jgi:hypothetical protein
MVGPARLASVQKESTDVVAVHESVCDQRSASEEQKITSKSFWPLLCLNNPSEQHLPKKNFYEPLIPKKEETNKLN